MPAPNSGFVAVAAGWNHSLGLRADGTLVTWGDNTVGQCNIPAPNAGFVAIAADGIHSEARRSDGSVVFWGAWNRDNGPVANEGFVSVAAGNMHSLGLRSDGSVVAWGYNAEGQCDVPTPNTGFRSISANGARWFGTLDDGFSAHSLGLKLDGSIAAWGGTSLASATCRCRIRISPRWQLADGLVWA